MGSRGNKLGSLPLSVGDVVGGKYRLERLLGEGGTGLVVLARHLSLDRDVAIKFLRPALATREVVTRFEREAHAISRLHCEYVVDILDVGRLPDGDPYMVMERLEGEDLAQVLREGGLPPGDAIDCMLQVCEALHAAHGLGVIHRDLKPANLFLTRSRDGVPHVKVVDFGISKLTDPRLLGGGAADVTHASAVLGSPKYMAPEQLRSSRDVDARCDIWSVGAVLYQLLSGALPFDGETNVQASVKVLSSEPRPLVEVAPHVRPELAAVVHRCLVKELAGRWSTARDLQEALMPFASETARALLEEHRALQGSPDADYVSVGGAPVAADSLVPSSRRPPAGQFLRPPPPASPGLQIRGLEPTPVPVVLAPGGAPAQPPAPSRALKIALVLGGAALAFGVVALVVGLGFVTAAQRSAGASAPEPSTVSLDAGDGSP